MIGVLKSLGLLLTVACSLSACGMWVRSPPIKEINSFMLSPASDSEVFSIKEEKLAHAIAFLKKQKIVKLDHKMADALDFNFDDDNNNYYLVRSVRSGPGGKFTAHIFRNTIYVIHERLGVVHDPEPSAVIIRSRHGLNDVYGAAFTIE